jgi:hypothetical protein
LAAARQTNPGLGLYRPHPVYFVGKTQTRGSD